MSEIDFDELDKAVNSLMANGTRPQQRQVQNASSGMSDGARPNPVAQDAMASNEYTVSAGASSVTTAPVVSQNTTTTSTSTTETPVVSSISTPTQTPAIKRRGQFMDVMHPSSDMRTTDTVPRRPVAREGSTITPSAAPASAPKTEANPTERPVESSVQNSTPFTMPDPIDMEANAYTENANAIQPPSLDDAELTKQLSELTELEASGATTNTAEPTDKKEEPISQEEPVSSPFIPDAKVEKRPLGTPMSQPEPVNVQSTAVETHAPDTQSASFAQDQQIKNAMPAELDKDLLKIESDNTVSGANIGGELTELPGDDEPEKPVGGPASIPMQYKEKSTDVATEPAVKSVYDPSNYHEAVKKPVKKKSGWGVVVLIITLVLLGAGGGAFVYFVSTGAIKF